MSEHTSTSAQRRLLLKLTPLAILLLGFCGAVVYVSTRSGSGSGSSDTVVVSWTPEPARRSRDEVLSADPTAVARLVTAMAQVTADSFFTSATPDACIEVRSDTSGLRIACVAPGARLRKLGESRTLYGTTWEKVEAPNGEAGWIDARYLR